jgi:hypothetical protein
VRSDRPTFYALHTFQPRANSAGDRATSLDTIKKPVWFHYRPYKNEAVLNRSAAPANVSAFCALLSSSSCSRLGASSFAAARAFSAEEALFQR